MAAIRIDEAPAPAPALERRLDAARYPDRGNTVMPTVAHEVARLVARDVLATGLEPDAFVAVELTLYLQHGDPKRFLIPDVLVALGRGQADPVRGGRRHVYRIWDEGGPPDLVIELASKRTVKRDNVGKEEDYAACGVREYVQFDPLGPADPDGPLLVPRLWVWRLAGGRYARVARARGGGYPSAVLPGLEWVRVGDLLRLREEASGTLLPTATEQQAIGRLRAEAQAAQAADRANAEAARADTEATARSRAEAEAAREAARADAEAARAAQAEAELARLRAAIARQGG